MIAGKLRHRVTLQSRLTQTRDAVGGIVSAWSTYATVWARKVPQGAAERLLGQQVVGESLAAWSIRYRSGVDVTHRLIDGATTWEINGITDPDDRKREMVLSCRVVQ